MERLASGLGSGTAVPLALGLQPAPQAPPTEAPISYTEQMFMTPVRHHAATGPAAGLRSRGRGPSLRALPRQASSVENFSTRRKSEANVFGAAEDANTIELFGR